MSCPVCRVVDVTEITLELGGRRVTMHSCRRCEARWWDEEGTRVALRHVLTLVNTP